MNQMSPTKGRNDVVEEPVGVGGEKDVRHGAKSYTCRALRPMLGPAACGV